MWEIRLTRTSVEQAYQKDFDKHFGISSSIGEGFIDTVSILKSVNNGQYADEVDSITASFAIVSKYVSTPTVMGGHRQMFIFLETKKPQRPSLLYMRR